MVAARPSSSALCTLCACTSALATLCPQVFGILSFLVGIMMIVFSSGVFYLEVESTKDCIAEAEVPRR